MYQRLIKELQDLVSKEMKRFIIKPTVEEYVIIEEILESIETEIKRLCFNIENISVINKLMHLKNCIEKVFNRMAEKEISNIELIETEEWLNLEKVAITISNDLSGSEMKKK